MKYIENLIKEEYLKISENQTFDFDRIPVMFKQLQELKKISIEDYFCAFETKNKIFDRLSAVLDFKNDNSNSKNDFSGLYIFYYNELPFYVGISRSVLNRINQHLKGKSHFNATLAHKLCRKIHPISGMTRHDFHREKETEIIEIQNFLAKCHLKLFPVSDPNELYLLEIYASLQLKTPFNDFKTH